MIVTYYIKKRSDGGAMKEILVFFKSNYHTVVSFWIF